MKFFAIYTNATIVNKPEWLDSFRAKYDISYAEHFTLTQPRYIRECDIENLKQAITKYFERNKFQAFTITCDVPHLDRQDATNDGCVMIAAQESQQLKNLQQDLVAVIGTGYEFRDHKYVSYEKEFVPHITIARDLSRNIFEAATAELPSDLTITVDVSEVTLAIVADESAEERMSPENLTTFKLS